MCAIAGVDKLGLKRVEAVADFVTPGLELVPSLVERVGFLPREVLQRLCRLLYAMAFLDRMVAKRLERMADLIHQGVGLRALLVKIGGRLARRLVHGAALMGHRLHLPPQR